MIKVKEEEKQKYLYMFNEYTHNIPVIYSSLEGQYEGELYIDNELNTQIAILFTPFAFHFVAGDSKVSNVIDIVDEMIFKRYLSEHDEKEAIVFSPNGSWDEVLDTIFKKHNGIKDKRVLFSLNKDKFMKRYEIKKENSDIEKKIVYDKAGGSNTEYPTCKIYVDQKCVSFCSGFMLGKEHAEINISTEEEYRRKGYARETAFTLIKELISRGIEPDWCAWSHKESSRKLAESLGFELAEEIPTHIWVEDECGKLV